MRFLFTADWQAEWANLYQCKTAWKKAIAICLERKLEGIVVIGDLKHQYNPVDIRVTKFWMIAITLAKKKGLRVIIVLGNHDRVGQYTDAQNWLSILRRAGAETFDDIGKALTNDGIIHALPFTTSLGVLRSHSRTLAESNPSKKTDVLVFHQDLKECRYNQLGQKSGGKFGVKDLHPSRYLYCIGGHVHLKQKLGENVYYVGSPFAMDWGESNQEKRFLVIEDDRLTSIPTGMVGFYDPSWPGFPKHKVSWKDERVRIHVKCSSNESYGKALEHARVKAEKRFPGAIITVKPEFNEAERTDVTVGANDSDKKKIRAYVEQTLPAELTDDKERIISYLDFKVRASSGKFLDRKGDKLEFLGAKARNYLSFKKLEVDFRDQGIVVVTGKNNDTGKGKSNGAGKTNFGNIIPVTFFGSTFKGQKADRWGRRGSRKRSYVSCSFKTKVGGNKHVCIATRSRRPTSIVLKVNGSDQSSGLRGNAKSGTQGLIEQVTGFTWQTLANAVYIDESISRAFLKGTNKERTDVLGRFQNLERFSLALQVVKRDNVRAGEELKSSELDLAVCKDKIVSCKESIADAKRSLKKRVTGAKEQLYKRHKEYIKLKEKFAPKIESLHKHKKELTRKRRKLNKKHSQLEHRLGKISERMDHVMSLHNEASRCTHIGVCPTCYQAVSVSVLRKHILAWKEQEKKLNKVHRRIKQELSDTSEKSGQLTNAIGKIDVSVSEYSEQLEAARSREHIFHLQLEKEQEESNKNIDLQKLQKRLKLLQKERIALKRLVQCYESKVPYYNYCEDALSRNGLPAFLNAQLCPVLNKAAAYYAELFFDGLVNVRFKVEGGEFVPTILNSTGGENIDDQSKGEIAQAGIISSFALREVAPECNLLILDEPGDGLDPVNAKLFAIGLQKLKKRFGTIYIMSYNDAILNELSAEKQIVIEKRNGISKLISTRGVYGQGNSEVVQ